MGPFVGRRIWMALALFALLPHCGGGGGGGGGGNPTGGPSFQISPAALSFSALANAEAPAPQAVSVTLNGTVTGTLYFKVVVSRPDLVSVTSVNVTGPETGQATVTPATPAVPGPGKHTGTITVVGCTSDVNCSTGPLLGGSPQTINVTYAIDPALQGDVVAPSTVAAGVPGEVVIRGQGLSQTSSITFGSSSATSSTIVSDTELRVTHPALAAGIYPVGLHGTSGPIPFSGSLVTVAAPDYQPTTLSYPSGPVSLRAVLYDPRQQAILAATDSDILRYAFSNSAWQAPSRLPAPLLRDISWSIDGASVLALTNVALLQLDPVTLAATEVTAGPRNGPVPVQLARLAVANDGLAVVTAEEFDVFLFAPKKPAFHRVAVGGDAAFPPFGALPAASANGSLIGFIQGQLSPAPAVLRYVGGSGVLSALPTHLNRISVNLPEMNPLPAVDRSGTRLAFDSSAGDFSGIGVFDADLTLLGALPGTTAAVAFSPDPAGPATRAYTVDGCKVRAFDLGSQVAGSFTEITAAPYPIDIGCLGNHPRLLLTADGHTAILAGDQQIVVVGTP